MTLEEDLNALTRFVLLFGLALYVTTRHDRILIMTVLTLASICVYYYHEDGRIQSHRRRRNNHHNLPQPQASQAAGLQEGYQNRAIDALTAAEAATGDQGAAAAAAVTPDAVAALFDSASTSNPFANVLLTDYTDNPDKKPAEPAHTDDFVQATGTLPPVGNFQDNVLNQAKQLVLQCNPGQEDLAEKLFADMSDQFVFEQAMGRFYSNPATTIPNDQKGFSEFCYGSMISCKEGNMFACARNLPNYSTGN